MAGYNVFHIQADRLQVESLLLWDYLSFTDNCNKSFYQTGLIDLLSGKCSLNGVRWPMQPVPAALLGAKISILASRVCGTGV
jgi:hypothetical protein